MSHWYFAYGSNLRVDQVIERTGPLVLMGDERPQVARLPDYQLVFNMSHDGINVFANIMPGGNGVWGVVYQLTEQALEQMDRYEQGYQRERIAVWIRNGPGIEVETYVSLAGNLASGRSPSAAYLEKIVKGAGEQGLPKEYIEMIEQVAKGKRGPTIIGPESRINPHGPSFQDETDRNK